MQNVKIQLLCLVIGLGHQGGPCHKELLKVLCTAGSWLCDSKAAVCTSLFCLGLDGVSHYLWHKNGYCRMHPYFIPWNCFPFLVQGLSWVSLWILSGYKNSATASNFQWAPCVVALVLCAQVKGNLKPLLAQRGTMQGKLQQGQTLSCQPCFCSGSHGCQPFLALMDVWWVWIMGCQENYLS